MFLLKTPSMPVTATAPVLHNPLFVIAEVVGCMPLILPRFHRQLLLTVLVIPALLVVLKNTEQQVLWPESELHEEHSRKAQVGREFRLIGRLIDGLIE